MDDLGDLVWKSVGVQKQQPPPPMGIGQTHATNSRPPTVMGMNGMNASSTPTTSIRPTVASMGPTAVKPSSPPKPVSQPTTKTDPFGQFVSFGTNKLEQDVSKMSLEEQRLYKLNQQQSLASGISSLGGMNVRPATKTMAVPVGGIAYGQQPVAPSSIGFYPSQQPVPMNSSLPMLKSLPLDPLASTKQDTLSQTSVSSLPLSFSQSTLPAYKPQDTLVPSQTNYTASKPHSQQAASWDFDFLEKPSSSIAQHSVAALTDDPFDIHFLNAKNDMSHTKNQVQDENILGLLAGPPIPVQATPLQTASPPAPTQPTTTHEQEHQDADIARIMEMGFTAEMARNALEASQNNVQEAIDMLLQHRNATQPDPSSKRGVSFVENPTVFPESPRETASQKKDRVMNAATSIGLSVLSGAKTMLNMTKQKLTEVVEKAKDMDIANGITTRTNRTSQDMLTEGRKTPSSWNEPSRYRDEDESVSKMEDEERLYNKKTASLPQKTAALDIFSSHDSPSHHIPSISASPRRDSPKPLLSRPPLKQMPQLVIPGHILDQATHHKQVGNDFFKKGQYGDASASYTAAVDLMEQCVPSDTQDYYTKYTHPLLVALLNNRAASCLKTGENKQVVLDCTKITSMKDAMDAMHCQGLNSEDYKKSLSRRALAYEALEKMDLARDDYKVLLSLDPGNVIVSKGLARCVKALEKDHVNADTSVMQATQRAAMMSDSLKLDPLDNSTSTTTAIRPIMSEATAAQVQQAVDEAVNALRAQHLANEQEEALKLSLKDDIDARVERWRKGKEQNLRALLSSLDTILWPALGFKNIGLNELLTPQQVKSKYMRAVAKIHPDKLSNDENVENKLIAQEVFSSLNKAWDAFKTQNNL